jgi:hypothetical protein
MNQYLIDDEIDALSRADDLDTLIDAASRPATPWTVLLNRARQSLQRAIQHLSPQVTPRSLNHALYQINGAEALLNDASREVRRVMSGTRQISVLTQLRNAMIRIQAARAQTRGGSAAGGRNLSNPRILLGEAIAHIHNAQNTVGLRSLPGGRGGRVRADVSSWPSLLNRSIQVLELALRHLGPPLNVSNFNTALTQAEGLLNQAGQEVRRVMSGARQTAVLDQLSNAATRIQAARAQTSGSSLLGGRSLIDPGTSVRDAIEHIRNAQNAVGLR